MQAAVEGLTIPDESVLEELDSDWDIVCDYSGKDRRWCDGNPAEWVARWRCPSCAASGVRTICTPCKDLVCRHDVAGMCPTCGEIVAKFRHLFVVFEPLRP